jgi:hypothetical protein
MRAALRYCWHWFTDLTATLFPMVVLVCAVLGAGVLWNSCVVGKSPAAYLGEKR